MSSAGKKPVEGRPRRSPHDIIRKSAYLFGAYGFREILQTLFFVYLARRASSTYGEIMLGMSAGQILLFITDFGLNQYLVPLLTGKKEGSADVLAQVTILKTCLLLFGLGGLWVFSAGQSYSSELRNLVIVMGIGFGSEALASSFFVACQARGRQDVEGKIRSLAALLGFGFGTAGAFLGAPPSVIALYKILESLINIMGSAWFIVRDRQFVMSIPQLGHIWEFWRGSLIFTAMALATTVYNRANVFFLQQAGGAEAVAQYSVTWQLVDGISAMVSNLLLKNILFPLFATLWRDDRAELARMVRKATTLLLTTSIPIMLVLGLESDRIITLIYGPGYSESIWMQQYLVLTIGLGFIHNLAAYLMMAMDRSRMLLGFYLAGLVVNVACCSWLIPTHPYAGSISAMLITKAFVAVLSIGYCQRVMGLFQARYMVHLGAALVVGGTFYLLGKAHLPREVAELMALCPLALLARRWRHDFPVGSSSTPGSGVRSLNTGPPKE